MTTDNKHTLGPWEWWTSCSWKRLTSKDERGRWMREGNVLCPSIASDGHPVLNVSAEDMALIAAAPELLEALRSCAAILPRYRLMGKTLGDDEEHSAVMETVDAAIAKATQP